MSWNEAETTSRPTRDATFASSERERGIVYDENGDVLAEFGPATVRGVVGAVRAPVVDITVAGELATESAPRGRLGWYHRQSEGLETPRER